MGWVGRLTLGLEKRPVGFRGSPDTHTWPVSPVWGVSGPLLLDPGAPRPPSHGLPGTLGQARASQLLRAGVPHVRAPASGALGSGDERTQVCLVLRHPPGSLPVLSSVQSRGWGTPGAPPLHATPPPTLTSRRNHPRLCPGAKEVTAVSVAGTPGLSRVSGPLGPPPPASSWAWLALTEQERP